jgi:gliding motility-associated-like protein
MTVSNDVGECGAIVNYTLPVLSDNCGVEQMILDEGFVSGTYFSLGSTTITYTAVDVHGNTSQCSFEITVIDDELPVIDCPEDIVSLSDTVYYPYPTFSDNCYAELMLIEGGDAGTEFEHGFNYVLFAAVDMSGNMDTCGFNILVNLPPVALNDTVVIFESDGVVDIEAILNDYDPDGDDIVLWDIIYGGDIAYIDGGSIIFDIPDNECGIDSVIYVLMDQYGATDTATVYVNVDCYPSVFVPEGFSPNGDGVNDVLHILGLHEYPNNELMIFNRWGHKVFERKDYQNDWNGMSEAALTIGETKLPRGTYYYVLDLHDSRIRPMKGFIYINPR